MTTSLKDLITTIASKTIDSFDEAMLAAYQLGLKDGETAALKGLAPAQAPLHRRLKLQDQVLAALPINEIFTPVSVSVGSSLPVTTISSAIQRLVRAGEIDRLGHATYIRRVEVKA